MQDFPLIQSQPTLESPHSHQNSSSAHWKHIHTRSSSLLVDLIWTTKKLHCTWERTVHFKLKVNIWKWWITNLHLCASQFKLKAFSVVFGFSFPLPWKLFTGKSTKRAWTCAKRRERRRKHPSKHDREILSSYHDSSSSSRSQPRAWILLSYDHYTSFSTHYSDDAIWRCFIYTYFSRSHAITSSINFFSEFLCVAPASSADYYCWSGSILSCDEGAQKLLCCSRWSEEILWVHFIPRGFNDH